jgi:small subunit ribosomal protein S16
VRIRLRRTGAKNAPQYRLVAVDGRSKRDGRFIELLGHHNPTAEPAITEINEERALYWLSVGAQPSETAKRLLSKAGVLKKFEEMKTTGVQAD